MTARAPLVLVARKAGIVDGDDIRIIELGDLLRFALQIDDAAGQPPLEHLDHDWPFGLSLLPKVNPAEPRISYETLKDAFADACDPAPVGRNVSPWY